ncbi:hypothetical protein [uncultured Jannaschia sp.]|uniref:hypothetical protein n=1 Tax=uncultured Jannaschia sp. TaxID=293347 RepID=UPI00262FED84|nr:hypothetical protein [uncultured Jannaschia sp.]
MRTTRTGPTRPNSDDARPVPAESDIGTTYDPNSVTKGAAGAPANRQSPQPDDGPTTRPDPDPGARTDPAYKPDRTPDRRHVGTPDR